MEPSTAKQIPNDTTTNENVEKAKEAVKEVKEQIDQLVD